jgi:hypothetical protein
MIIGYDVDELMHDRCTDTLTDAVDKKVSLLYDFCVLMYNHNKQDAREEYVRRLLNECGNEHRMSIVLRDVLTEKITLDELLHKKGLM